MSAYVVKLEGGRMVAHWSGPPGVAKLDGYRPFVWTDDVSRAEKFDSPLQAAAWAEAHLPHMLFEISRILPTGPTGRVTLVDEGV